jgi:hypothetical protein
MAALRFASHLFHTAMLGVKSAWLGGTYKSLEDSRGYRDLETATYGQLEGG